MERYTYNTDIYTTINEESFYFLGVVASDGVLEKHHIKIGLKDKDLVEELRDRIVPNKPLYKDNRNDVFYLKISNKQIMDFVRSSGITERKSLTLKMNEWVLKRKEFIHFIRGFFDGDGTVGIVRNSRKDKNYYRPQMRICSASINILLQIQYFLIKEYGLNKNKIISEKENTFFRLRYIGKEAEKFYNAIYQNKSIFLKRKFIRYSNILKLDNNQRSEYYGHGKEKIEELNLRLL